MTDVDTVTQHRGKTSTGQSWTKAAKASVPSLSLGAAQIVAAQFRESAKPVTLAAAKAKAARLRAEGRGTHVERLHGRCRGRSTPRGGSSVMNLASSRTIEQLDSAVLDLLSRGWERCEPDDSGVAAVEALSAQERRELRVIVASLLSDLDTFNWGEGCSSDLVALRDLLAVTR